MTKLTMMDLQILFLGIKGDGISEKNKEKIVSNLLQIKDKLEI
jgi:hypothetical protein